MQEVGIVHKLQDWLGLSQHQIAQVKKVQRSQGIGFVRAAFQQGVIGADNYVRFLCTVFKLPAADTKSMQIPEEVQKLLPLHVCRRYHCIPFQRKGQHLYVATAEPDNILAQDDLRFMTGLDLILYVAAPDWVQKALDHMGRNAEPQFEGMDEALAQMDEQEELDWDTSEQETSEEAALLEQASQGPVVKIVNLIIMDAIRKKASDIHIENFEKLFRVRYRLDGVLKEVMRPPVRMRAAVVSRIKIMADLNIAEKRLPQDGRIKVRTPGGSEAEFRVSILPTLFGEKVVLRYLDTSALHMDMSKLGLDATTLDMVQSIIHRPYGIFLVTGPTGSGKTTTLYSALMELNTESVNISTVEDPVEFSLSGVNQVHVLEHIGLTFASTLRSFLRQDPDIILVGEIRDPETAEIAVKAALTGHLVLSTLHTNDAPSTVTRLLNMGVEGFMLASALSGVIAQRLVRVLCPACKQPISPETRWLRQLGLENEPDLQVYGPVGCQECHDNGYKGRIGIYEGLQVTPQMQRLIEDQAGLPEIKHLALEQGMQTLRQSAVAKLKQGLTSIQEVLRITVDE